MHDLVIANAKVVDGTGRAAFGGSVAVQGGRIVEVSTAVRIDGRAKRRIDADGRVVAPGFVDPHTHYDAQVAWDPLLTCSPWHGVTTVVTGNCGVGVAPMAPAMRDIALQDLVNVEAIPYEVMKRGIEWRWETFAEYLQAIRSRGIGINMAAMVPLTPLRQSVMGEASLDRAANDSEVRALARGLREAMDAGAFGWSATFIDNHVGYGGRPIACRQASREELGALCHVLRDVGRGVAEVAINQPVLGSVSDEGRELLAFLANESGRPLTYLALINDPDDPQSYTQAVEKLGPLLSWQRCVPQITAKPLSIQFGMRAPFALGGIRTLQQVYDKPLEVQLGLYRDPAFRASMREYIAKGGVFKSFFDRIRPLFANAPAVQALVASGKTVAEIAAAKRVDPLDAWLDMAVEDDLATVFDFKAANFEPEGVRNLLRDDRFLVGLSDGGAHVSQLCDAGYSTYLLGRWVRETPTLSLEEAVRKLTSVPADFFGIAGRGRLVEGHHADIVLFDPATVHADTPHVVEDLPGGAPRLVAGARGIAATIVNGEVLYFDGQHEGALPGAVLRCGQD